MPSQPASRFSLSIVSLLFLAPLLLLLSGASFAASPDRIAAAIDGGAAARFSAGVPLQANPQYDQGAVDPALQLGHMTLVMLPTTAQKQAIKLLISEQQDPRSPFFHQWITPQQYAERFGLSSNDTLKIGNWLASQGFHVIEVAPSRNLISFSGTAAQAEAAFQTPIHQFKVNGQSHFANTAPPSIPAALGGIVGSIGGLHNFHATPMIRMPKRAASATQPFYDDSSLGEQYLAPADLATIYNVNGLYGQSIHGEGQQLAVIGETDVYLADLADFRSGFSLPAIIGCSTNGSTGLITSCAAGSSNLLQYILIPGDTDPGAPDSLQDDLPEADLDLEWSAAIAKEAQIIYVNAPDPSGQGVWDAWHYAVTNNVAPVITMSYGLCELGEAQNAAVTTDESLLQEAITQGITFMNSSGDNGAAGCDPNSTDQDGTLATGGLAVSYPASSPEVTGVGGTMVPLGEYTSTYWGTGTTGGSAKEYIPENPWNDAFEIGTFCAANSSSSSCTADGITNPQTAQAAFGIASTGGGASNCSSINGSQRCTSGFAQPDWQSTLDIAGQTTSVHTTTGVAAARFSPDVSLLASPNFPGYIWCTPKDELSNTSPYDTESASSCAGGIAASIAGVKSGGNYVVYPSIVGGTSASSPIFAAIVTLLNQYVTTNSFQGSPGLGNFNPALYQMAVYNQSAFQPVTAGLNEPGSNRAYCQASTPSGQPSTLVCPAAVSPATEGVFGYLSATADASTGYNLATGLGSVNANNLATDLGELLTPSTTALSPSNANIVPGASETFTVTVTPAGASGIVTLYDNSSSTALGTATVTSGSGSFTTTALSVGGNSVVADYLGSYASSTSSAASVTVTAPAFVANNTGATTVTVLAGQTASGYSFTVAPASPATSFAGSLAFSCSGLDATQSCAFSPTSIAAGTSATTGSPITVTMTITTSGPNGVSAQLRRHAENRLPRLPSSLPFTLPLAGVVVAGLLGRKRSKSAGIFGLSVVGLPLFGLCLMVALLGLMLACGGGSSTPPVSVAVSAPTPASVYPNNTNWPSQTAQFTATVSNSSNTAVNWAVVTPNGGTISASGVYTAPTIASGLPTSVSVSATSQADSSVSGTGTIALHPATVPGNYSVTVSVNESTTVHTVGPLGLTVQ